MGAATTASLPHAKLGVLVVSANTVFRAGVVSSAMPRDTRRKEASSGAQAIAKLKLFACDVLFLDARLPDLDSMEIAEFARQKHPDVFLRSVDSTAAQSEVSSVVEFAAEEPQPIPSHEEPSAVWFKTELPRTWLSAKRAWRASPIRFRA